MADQTLPPEIAKMSFEDAMAELETLVRTLEGGQGSLDDAIASYERGTWLRRHCESKLADAQAKIDRIVAGASGALTTEPFDAT